MKKIINFALAALFSVFYISPACSAEIKWPFPIYVQETNVNGLHDYLVYIDYARVYIPDAYLNQKVSTSAGVSCSSYKCYFGAYAIIKKGAGAGTRVSLKTLGNPEFDNDTTWQELINMMDSSTMSNPFTVGTSDGGGLYVYYKYIQSDPSWGCVGFGAIASSDKHMGQVISVPGASTQCIHILPSNNSCSFKETSLNLKFGALTINSAVGAKTSEKFTLNCDKEATLRIVSAVGGNDVALSNDMTATLKIDGVTSGSDIKVASGDTEHEISAELTGVPRAGNFSGVTVLIIDFE